MVTLTNAEGYVVPSDLREAIQYVFEKLKKLLSERRATADMVRDIIKDAKEDGYKTKAVRQAIKLDSLSPEKREAWLEEINTAAALFGMAGLAVLDHDNKDEKLWAHVQKIRYLRNDLKELAALIKDLRTKAKERGVDYDALAYLTRHEKAKDPDENHSGMNWMERLDAMAGSLGYW